jgi:hypothetical protein
MAEKRVSQNVKSHRGFGQGLAGGEIHTDRVGPMRPDLGPGILNPGSHPLLVLPRPHLL